MNKYTVHKHLVLIFECEAASADEAMEMAIEADEIEDMRLEECEYIVFDHSGLQLETSD